jgi:hypothetical protein
VSAWETLRDAVGLTLRPIDTWPGRLTHSRERAPYSAPLKGTLADLKRELRQLGARNIVLQISFRERDFRLDGLPRADARAPEHPGVILAFESCHGPLRIHMDKFVSWEHNLRAIAQHLEHLRLAGLYGVGQDGQQYTGWKALPEGAVAVRQDDVSAAAELLAQHSRPNISSADILKDQQKFLAVYRLLTMRLHPDRGGDHDTFVRIRQAGEVVLRYFLTRAA